MPVVGSVWERLISGDLATVAVVNAPFLAGVGDVERVTNKKMLSAEMGAAALRGARELVVATAAIGGHHIRIGPGADAAVTKP